MAAITDQARTAFKKANSRSNKFANQFRPSNNEPPEWVVKVGVPLLFLFVLISGIYFFLTSPSPEEVAQKQQENYSPGYSSSEGTGEIDISSGYIQSEGAGGKGAEGYKHDDQNARLPDANNPEETVDVPMGAAYLAYDAARALASDNWDGIPVTQELSKNLWPGKWTSFTPESAMLVSTEEQGGKNTYRISVQMTGTPARSTQNQGVGEQVTGDGQTVKEENSPLTDPNRVTFTVVQNGENYAIAPYL